jgi:ribosomal protein S18 acetylase RimI-like enzyme
MTPRVRLEPMPAAAFPAWSRHSLEGFVRQQVDAGLQPEADARRDAERVLATELPAGAGTPGHHLLHALDPAGAVLGTLWLRVRAHPDGVEAYVLDVEVLPEARGRGLGRATVLAAHDLARSLGATELRLTVFGPNRVARALYESLGYGVEELALHLPLPEKPPPVPAAHGLVLRGASVWPGPWTAYAGDVLVGRVEVRLVERSDGLRALLTHLEVAMDQRGRGRGRAVLDAAVRACADLGVRAVHVSLSGDGLRAAQACRQRGFVVTARTMARRS